MGKVSKKIVEKQKEDAKRTEKLIADLLWYVKGMNECIENLVKEANDLNLILQSSIDDFKENKDVMVQ